MPKKFYGLLQNPFAEIKLRIVEIAFGYKVVDTSGKKYFVGNWHDCENFILDKSKTLIQKEMK